MSQNPNKNIFIESIDSCDEMNNNDTNLELSSHLSDVEDEISEIEIADSSDDDEFIKTFKKECIQK